MAKKLEGVSAQKDKNKHHVLFAPTWGKNGLLTRYGMKAIAPLAEAGFRIVIRPHPQTAISEPEILEAVQRDCKLYENVAWDFSSDPLEAMVEADILISDISGIVFDFAFLMKKSVLTLDFDVEKDGFEASDLPYEPWELEALHKVGRKVFEDELSDIQEIVQSEIANENRVQQIEQMREKYVVNFGKAAGHVATQLERLLQE